MHSKSAIDYCMGDKVRVKLGEAQGSRGIITNLQDEHVEVAVDGSCLLLPLAAITNYSAAARKAWRSMPKRSGRPRSARQVKKMVSMRLDPDLWDRLGRAVEMGWVSNREQGVTDWVRAGLDELECSHRREQK